MRVQVVDPAGLHAAVRPRPVRRRSPRAGAEVELVTCRFPYGPVPAAERLRGHEASTAQRSRPGIGARRRRLLRAAEHLPDMRRYRRVAERADLVHYQWLPIPALDRRLLAPKRPRVFTMHWRLPEARRADRRERCARLLAEMDAVVVHSEHGARRLEADFGVPAERLRVIPHGAFDYLTRQPDEVPLPAELAAVEKPGGPRLRADPPVQGNRRAARGLPRGRGRRALDRRHAPDADGAAARAGATGAGEGPLRRPLRHRSGDPGASCAAPTWSSCPTGTSSSRASSTPRSPSAGRWC